MKPGDSQDPMSDFNMIMALQDEAYKLAELNMPYSREEYPNRDEYEDALEMEGEYQLMQMMTNPKYAPVRERYIQSIPKMTETDEFPQEFIDTYKGNPMDLAWRLLKNEPADYSDTYHRVRNNIGADGEYMTDEELNAIDERYSELHDDESHLEEYYNLLEAIELEKKRRAEESFDGIGLNEETGFTRSEPMDLAWRLLKEPVSPEAKRHKLEYDKKYESTPERVKYREELNRERRRRGIYGHGGPDMSHTKDHTLVAESPHANRARHFKERGTLKG
jgi:hypothetical protein